MQEGVRDVAFSSTPMNRFNQTESAVFMSCMPSVTSKDPFSDCGQRLLMCLGKISKIRKNSFFSFLSPLNFHGKMLNGGTGVETIIKKTQCILISFFIDPKLYSSAN